MSASTLSILIALDIIFYGLWVYIVTKHVQISTHANAVLCLRPSRLEMIRNAFLAWKWILIEELRQHNASQLSVRRSENVEGKHPPS